jgi:hypothetical protein
VLVDQRFQLVKRRVADALCGLKRASAGKDGEASKETLLIGI